MSKSIFSNIIVISKKYLFFSIVILLAGCDYFDSSLKIVNKSKTQIAVEESNNRDSIFFNNIEYYLSNVIEPDSTVGLIIGGKVGAWKRHVQNGSERKLFIYVFAVDTLKKYQNKYTMHDFYALDKYAKRFELSEKQLDSMNWEVVFDGSINHAEKAYHPGE